MSEMRNWVEIGLSKWKLVWF